MIDALLVAVSLACASCGSGGDDPMILYPNESAKLYLGLAHSSGYRDVGVNGNDTDAAGPDSKATFSLALAKSFSRRAFATMTIPYARNQKESESRQSLADPSFTGRFTAVMPNIATLWIPQVQILFGYKTARAPSIRETRPINVFGTGFPEWRAGVDVWYGLAALKFGIAWVIAYPESRQFGSRDYQPGIGQRATATIAYSWTSMFKSTFGVNREQRNNFVIDGTTQPGSDQGNNGAFLNHDVMLTPVDAIRFGYSRLAAFGGNRNTARATNVNLAYMRSF